MTLDPPDPGPLPNPHTPQSVQAQFKSQRTRVARQRLLEAAARVADEAGRQLAGAVLQLLGGCGRTHSPTAILQVHSHMKSQNSRAIGAPTRSPPS
jgi:hypothetical protein